MAKGNLTFTLTDKETKLINDAIKAHIRVMCGEQTRVQYHLTPTGIGLTTKIHFLCCGESIDVTDYEAW